ncbi:M28 family metallopeptidase [Mucilaginibacter terrae]|uniref:Zn-dependent M28 family amino/carboxypeptidase n=1 Tax=Mucilaginibacter terrae TaxID=1955052 RepID=A0ABU3GT39_9SPHI|nr:M28 family metallopeptidase [Mucilaginibacter terrae]MDT3402636.1 Zn-dependent M28 family amino/carboxypeptidase [Mucilaginibacter terrae]
MLFSKISRLASCLILGAVISAFAQKNVQGFSAETYTKYVKAIASDELLGRMPFSAGESKTIQYLEQQFKALGLEPGNKGSYLQEVPMVAISCSPKSGMNVTTPNSSFNLEGFKDYVIWTRRTDAIIDLKSDEVVFAGFGITAPEFNHDDYAGLDVKGKVVVVLVNDPGYYDAKQFKGKTMTYYGRWTYKYDEAARHGAKGCLIIHDTAPAAYNFSVVQNSWKTTKLYLDSRGKETYKCAVEGWLTLPATEQLLQTSGTNYKTLLANALKSDFKAIPLPLKLNTGINVWATYKKSHNVVAKISGTQKADECIVYSAHWDHFGVSKPDAKGDSIYNGAVDNASGTAALLELARVFKQNKVKPARSIVFLSVTAEEQGLWGSAWYAENPVFPKEKTVADINMDMFYPYGKTKDIGLVGFGQSELEDYLKEEAVKQGRYIAPEADASKGMYFRSDHFNFAKVGIPALYTESGVDLIGKGKEVGLKMHNDYTANTYHKPSDEVTANWDVSGTIQDLELLYAVGKKLSYSTTLWPKWKVGSEFKAIREHYKK